MARTALKGDQPFRPLPERVGRALTSRVVEVLCGAVGVALLVLVVWTGLVGWPWWSPGTWPP